MSALSKKSYTSLLICVVASAALVAFPERSVVLLSGYVNTLISRFDLFFLITCSAILVVGLSLAFSRFGALKLGSSEPEFSRFSWICMLFAAGMGSGLVFWGVAEPLLHLNAPLNPEQSKHMALALTHFHWGLHAWGIYAISGLCIAWYSFQYQRPMTISAGFSADAEGQKKFYLFDFLAVLAIIFGVAGTFANSIALIETGVQKTLAADAGGFELRLAVLGLISVCFVTSSCTGLKRGIKHLSTFNIILAVLIMLSVLVLASPLTIASEFVASTFRYIRELPRLSFYIASDSASWSQNWSIINLVWWIAWAPFVGLFIARISRGRSVREFLLTVILVPTLASMIWFSVLLPWIASLLQ